MRGLRTDVPARGPRIVALARVMEASMLCVFWTFCFPFPGFFVARVLKLSIDLA